MATFFGIACDLIRSRAAALKLNSELWTEPGRDGFGVHTLGQGDSPFTFVLIEFGSSAAVDSWIASIEGKQGSQGTVVDDWGTAFANMFARRMSVPRKTAEVGNGGARGEIVVQGVRLL